MVREMSTNSEALAGRGGGVFGLPAEVGEVR